MSKTRNLNRKLVLEGKTEFPNGSGGFISIWTALGTLWASVDVRSGRLRETSLNDKSTVTLKITIRASPVGASSRPIVGQRFVEGTRIYTIEAVSEDDPMGMYLSCWAKEEVMQ